MESPMQHKNLLEAAYDAEVFRKRGKELVDQLADYLKEASSNKSSLAVLPKGGPEELLSFWDNALQQKEEHAHQWMQDLIDQSIHLHHPHYMGHQISPPLPIAALSGLLSDLLNNGMGVYEMGPAATALERSIIKLVARQLGMNQDLAGGFLTSGGTLANLTALLSARRAKAPVDVWTAGHEQKLAVLVSEQAHYCIDRAARIMGFGSEGIVKVPADHQYKMQTNLLPEYWKKTMAKGYLPIAVIGSACSTSTGSYDNLEAIADFCKEKDLWFHVDGAHGGAATFSRKYSPLLKGAERADSVVMDFHKMLMTPALATALVFRKDHSAHATFSQQAQYLWESAETTEWHNLAKQTFECTKYMMSVKIFSILKTHGLEIFEQYVDTCFDLGQQFAALIGQHPHFDLATPPDCNIVCFRLIKGEQTVEALNALNTKMRKAVIARGRFYIVQTILNGTIFLRVTLTNPFTKIEDLKILLEEIMTL